MLCHDVIKTVITMDFRQHIKFHPKSSIFYSRCVHAKHRLESLSNCTIRFPEERGTKNLLIDQKPHNLNASKQSEPKFVCLEGRSIFVIFFTNFFSLINDARRSIFNLETTSCHYRYCMGDHWSAE